MAWIILPSCDPSYTEQTLSRHFNWKQSLHGVLTNAAADLRWSIYYEPMCQSVLKQSGYQGAVVWQDLSRLYQLILIRLWSDLQINWSKDFWSWIFRFSNPVWPLVWIKCCFWVFQMFRQRSGCSGCLDPGWYKYPTVGFTSHRKLPRCSLRLNSSWKQPENLL